MSDTETEQIEEAPAETFSAPLSADEPETDEDIDEDADEQEEAAQARDEAAVQSPRTAAELEAQRSKLQRSATTWRNRVSDVLGEDAQLLIPCPLCEPDIPGFMFPPDVVHPYNDTHARLLAVLREPEPPEYKPSNRTRTCGECDGLGKVQSGSRVPGQELLLCPECKGTGYTPPPGFGPNGAGDEDETLRLMGAPPEPISHPDVDPWGSPYLMPDGQENPNYGKMPQFKNPALP